MIAFDKDGNALKVGDSVTLNTIPNDLLDGLLEEDQQAIVDGLGKCWELEDLTESGLAEIVLALETETGRLQHSDNLGGANRLDEG